METQICLDCESPMPAPAANVLSGLQRACSACGTIYRWDGESWTREGSEARVALAPLADGSSRPRVEDGPAEPAAAGETKSGFLTEPHRCSEKSGGMRCELALGHEGDHRHGPAAWARVESHLRRRRESLAVSVETLARLLAVDARNVEDFEAGYVAAGSSYPAQIESVLDAVAIAREFGHVLESPADVVKVLTGNAGRAERKEHQARFGLGEPSTPEHEDARRTHKENQARFGLDENGFELHDEDAANCPATRPLPTAWDALRGGVGVPTLETRSPHLAGMTVPMQAGQLTPEAVERIREYVEDAAAAGEWKKPVILEEEATDPNATHARELAFELCGVERSAILDFEDGDKMYEDAVTVARDSFDRTILTSGSVEVTVTDAPEAAEARWQCGRCAAYNTSKDLSSTCETCGQNGDGSFTIPPAPKLVERPSLYLAFRLFAPRMAEVHTILSGGNPDVGSALDRAAVLWSDCERNLAILHRNVPRLVAHEIVKLVHVRIWLREVFVVVIRALRAVNGLFELGRLGRRGEFVRALEGTKYFTPDRPAEDPRAHEGIAIALGWADKISVDVPEPMVSLKKFDGVAARAAELFGQRDREFMTSRLNEYRARTLQLEGVIRREVLSWLPPAAVVDSDVCMRCRYGEGPAHSDTCLFGQELKRLIEKGASRGGE